MRGLVLVVLLPLAACASQPEPVQTAALDGAAKPEAAETKEVCWTEIVTGTRGRKQTVCRTERSQRNSDEARNALRDIQDHGGAAAGPPAIMGGN